VQPPEPQGTDGTYGRHLTIERPGCRIHYWLTGPPDAPLVTLSHAALVDHTFFAGLMPALAPHYQVLTWDIRGHGASRPLSGPFSVVDAVADLAAITDSLGIRRAVMLGQSMGTYVGQEMTFRHPDRVSALIVIGGTCITADPGWLGRESLKAAAPIMKAWPYASLKKESVKASAEEESSRDYLRQRFDELSKDEYLVIMDGVDRCIHPEPGYRTPGPTLLLVGEHDKTGDVRKSMTAWAQREPGDEYHVIAGAGHCANLDRPGEVNILIGRFLERHLPHQGRAGQAG
jgi:pimeloyl-ACP methyl ester carboxylesterase